MPACDAGHPRQCDDDGDDSGDDPEFTHHPRAGGDEHQRPRTLHQVVPHAVRECCTPHVMVLLPQRTDEETEPGDRDGEKQQTRPRRYPGVGIDARHEDHRNVVGEPDDHQDRVRDQERLGPMIAPGLMEGMNPREG